MGIRFLTVLSVSRIQTVIKISLISHKTLHNCYLIITWLGRTTHTHTKYEYKCIQARTGAITLKHKNYLMNKNKGHSLSKGVFYFPRWLQKSLTEKDPSGFSPVSLRASMRPYVRNIYIKRERVLCKDNTQIN